MLSAMAMRSKGEGGCCIFRAVNQVGGDASVHRSCVYTWCDGQQRCRRWECDQEARMTVVSAAFAMGMELNGLGDGHEQIE